MHEKRSSFTAAMVAFGRGLGIPELPADPWAKQLCPPALSQLLRVLEGNSLLREMSARASLGLAPHMAMRTALIDRALEAAVDEGAVQVVVLGAGLDARAWRLDALGSVRVFEVDHPATQAAKRREVGAGPANLTFVPVDFEVDVLVERLVDAGLDQRQVTAWVWEGVTMYLSRGAIEQTLDDVAQLPAPGSRLLLTYIAKEAIPFGETVAGLARNVFHFSGEYLHSWFGDGEFAGMLSERGFNVVSDSDDAQWARRLNVPRYFSGAFRLERLIEAHVQEATRVPASR